MRGARPNLTGQRFGRLTVVSKEPPTAGNRSARWRCTCECGGEAVARTDALRSGHTKSCGCLSAEVAAATHTRHGACRDYRLSREYTAWVNMRRRCSDQTTRHWKNYGGRGIRVCPEWEVSFAAFLEAVGPSPGRGFELDRTNNDGHYEPGNVRWVTKAENNANRRVSRGLA